MGRKREEAQVTGYLIGADQKMPDWLRPHVGGGGETAVTFSSKLWFGDLTGPKRLHFALVVFF